MEGDQGMGNEIFDAWSLAVFITILFYLCVQLICYWVPRPHNDALRFTVRYPAIADIEEAFRRQLEPPASIPVLNSKIRRKLQRIQGVVFFTLVDKDLIVGIVDKDVEKDVRDKLGLYTLRQLTLMFKSLQYPRLSHEPQCKLWTHNPSHPHEDTTTGPAIDTDIDDNLLKGGCSADPASIGVIIVTSDQDVYDGRVWLYLVTVAHVLPIMGVINALKRYVGRFYYPCYFMCGGKTNATQSCPFGCTEKNRRRIVPGDTGEMYHARGSFTPLVEYNKAPNNAEKNAAKNAVDILLIPISDEEQRKSMLRRLSQSIGERGTPGLIKVEFYPFSKITSELKIDDYLLKKTICMYSTKLGELLKGEIHFPCGDSQVIDCDGNMYCYQNVLLYSVHPKTQLGDSGTALFGYLSDPLSPEEKRLYLVGFHVAFPSTDRTKNKDKWELSEELCVAVKADISINNVIPKEHEKYAYIPENLHTQVMNQLQNI